MFYLFEFIFFILDYKEVRFCVDVLIVLLLYKEFVDICSGNNFIILIFLFL